MDENLKNFILDSYNKLKNYEKRGRYFHSLSPDDNKPVVLHKKTNQLTYVLSGKGIAVLNGEHQTIKKDSSLFVKAGTSHQFIATSEHLLLFHIHIPDEGRDNDRYIITGEDYDRCE